MHKIRNKGVVLSVILTLFFTLSPITDAQDYTVVMKIRYLKSFTKYVEWPASYKTGDFIIGILNNSKFADAMTLKLNGRSVGSQPYKVVNYSGSSAIQKCHVLYVPPEKSSELKDVLTKVKKYSTLVVTDKPGLVEKGSGINLIKVGPKQQFEINKKSLEKSQLSVSASLVPMATKVID